MPIVEVDCNKHLSAPEKSIITGAPAIISGAV
jgi:hypothetical protein